MSTDVRLDTGEDGENEENIAEEDAGVSAMAVEYGSVEERPSPGACPGFSRWAFVTVTLRVLSHRTYTSLHTADKVE